MGERPPSGWSSITRGQWLTLTAALLGWLFDGFEMGVFPIVARPALRELLGTPTEETVRQWNAILSAAFLFGASAGGWLFGSLGDRIGRVKAMMVSVLTYSLLTGFCALAHTPWQLAGLRFLAALGMGGEWALGVALVMETWPADWRPYLAGMIGAAGNLGYCIVAGLSLVITPKDYWRLLLVVCAAPAFLTFIIRLFVPESERWRTASASGPKARVTDAFAPGLRGHSLLGAAAGAVALLATWGAVQFTQLWAGQMTDGQPVHERAGAYVQLCSAGAATLGAGLAPILLWRVPRRAGYAVLCLGSLAAAEFLFLGHDHFDGSFLAAVGILGVTSAAFYGWLPLYLPELFPTRVRAAGQGFCYNAGRSLAAIGVLLTTAFQLDVSGNYPRMSALVCLVYVAGVALAWWLPETKGKPLPE
jgi:hypothetical protein